MSDTPDTDNACFQAEYGTVGLDVINPDFCRTIERKLRLAESTLKTLCALMAAAQIENGPVKYPTDKDKNVFADDKYTISYGGGVIEVVEILPFGKAASVSEWPK